MTRLIDKACERCGTAFKVPYKQRGQRFCGHSCAMRHNFPKGIPESFTAEAREKSAASHRGRGKGAGYIKRNGRHEHRVVAEQKLGRPLRKGEIAHHKDENRRNNAPDNIDVLPSQAEHARLHFSGKAKRRPNHCKLGHELTDGNTYTYPDGRRRCLTCRRTYDAAWKRHKREEAR